MYHQEFVGLQNDFRISRKSLEQEFFKISWKIFRMTKKTYRMLINIPFVLNPACMDIDKGWSSCKIEESRVHLYKNNEQSVILEKRTSSNLGN